MSARHKHDKIDLSLHFSEYWQKFSAHIPTFLRNPLQLIILTLKLINFTLEMTVFLVLLGQTAHVLSNSEKRYLNLRHLLIKWLCLIFMLGVEDHIKKHTSYTQLFTLFINVLSLLMIYPSKFIKNLHLKYFSFSEKKKYDEAEEDPSNYEMSFTTRMLVSITLFFLNSSRFIITFIPLHHRKKIEESMKGVNMIIVEEKYFWKMYESAWANPNPNPNPQQANPNTNPKFMGKSESLKDINKTAAQSKLTNRQNILRSKVSEFFGIVLTSLSATNRKYTFYRHAELLYNIETSQLTLTGEDDNKSVNHILVEVEIIEDGIVQLVCEDEDQPIYVKFKVKKEMDFFLNAIRREEQ